MGIFDKKKHWDNIYETKRLEEVSWYQETPKISLEFLQSANLNKEAKIIDVGGGDSFFVDHLLELGYHDVTVLDISGAAIERAKDRLGKQADKVRWIEADISTYLPKEKYDFWHDRAAFHFLTGEAEISSYTETAQEYIVSGGTLVIGAFSEQGPTKCSGIAIRQYSEKSMSQNFNKYFQKEECFLVDHKTPFDTVQNFIFCRFKRR